MPSPSRPITSLLFLRSLSTSPRDHLLRFAALAKELTDQPPPPPPPTRPRSPHPYDYNRLMSAHAASGDSAGANRALRLLDEMRSLLHRRPDAACFTTAAAALSSASRPGAALAVLEAMDADGVAPDAAACTVLVRVYACRLRLFDKAYEVVRWMAASGVAPDVVTYSTLISGLCSAGRVAEALGVLDLMLEEGCQPNAHTYTPIMHAYCVSGRIHEAKELLETMMAAGFAPSTATYNVLVEAQCKVGAFKEVDALVEESSTKGWTPDIITYSTYMDGLCKAGRIDKSFALVDKMLSNGLRPNVVTLNILLDGICRGSTALAAKCLLECSAEIGWHVNVVNYNTVMRRLCDERRWLAVVKLFADMVQKGIAPNSWTFSIVVHSLCKLGKLHKALCLLRNNEFVANVVTYNTLIRHLSFLGKASEAYLLLHEMAEEGIAPNDVTYGLVIDCLCREEKFLVALSCFYRSLDDGLSPSALSSIVRGLIAGGKLRELHTLVRWFLGQGFIIDVYMYMCQELIIAFCKKGYCRGVDMYKMSHILERMLGLK
ncbi:pentatricopeptide repeat-containing protein At3g22470, mitochondrial-like [Phragmites australis]|uniref:pentatricopeptide repeat-containing protein At3g22470, mitochondrial-like n=1 Tax=Phragmites australis TaxID=29695 RepID=UPI002D770C38|nr:pentatricopeptide repeat-containing protein At3g22470, mitochondrial-like [Phragmites australis]